jgi:Uri superfamily endonuclease
LAEGRAPTCADLASAASVADGRAAVRPARAGGTGHGAPWDQPVPGTYLLLLRLRRPTGLTVGRLGALALPAGWYVYVGSALGGLGPRLRRHLRPDKRCHWHVDHLRAAADVVAVAVRLGPERVECAVAAQVAGLPNARLAAGRFGASDCRCPGHLYRFTRRPGLRLDSAWQLTALPSPAGQGV